jgi:hypothetical protein
MGFDGDEAPSWFLEF